VITKHVGIDVSSELLSVRIDQESSTLEFLNTPAGHKALIRRLTKRGIGAKVCLEATGNYSLELSLALHQAPRIELEVINPLSARRFAEALLERSKDDEIDATVLLEYCKCMRFKVWEPPPIECLQLRALTRRIDALTRERTQEKNRLHAVKSCQGLPEVLIHDSEVGLADLKARIHQLEQQAQELTAQNAWLGAAYLLITTICGIAQKSGLMILGELGVLPRDMKAKQWVAHAGLDPRRYRSGTSIQRPSRISKRGNSILRKALYMPATVARQRQPQVRGFFQRLVDRGKTVKQAEVAVMRKMLHAIHAVLRRKEVFDAEKCFPTPEVA